MKTGQLWGKNKEDLTKQLDELKTELGQLRVQKIAGGSASKLTRMYVLFRICLENEWGSDFGEIFEEGEGKWSDWKGNEMKEEEKNKREKKYDSGKRERIG